MFYLRRVAYIHASNNILLYFLKRMEIFKSQQKYLPVGREIEIGVEEKLL